MNRKLIIYHLSFTILKSRGFSLVELLVAIGIIGVLASFLLANFVGVRERARDSVRKSNLRQIQSALEFYRSDQSLYPGPSLPNCGDPLVFEGTTYMKKIPCDPLDPVSTSYDYDIASGNSSYCLRSCLENTKDSDRDEIKYGENNKTITECSKLLICAEGKASYTLQDP
ncbi:MAG: type II secretion system protein [Candidatus Levybacteria bacterium]|nr:type II secretion system protein [Candidatus Levybacteria bacterium]